MYFDTTVILSLYIEDSFTRQAVEFYRRHATAATVSEWVDLEAKSALAFLVRTKRLAIERARLVLNGYETDRNEGRYRAVTIDPGAFKGGGNALTLDGSLRAGDALHLGVVLSAGIPLVTSDKVLHESAMADQVHSTYLPAT